MKFIDLTQIFQGSMPVYPGDSAAELSQRTSIDVHGCADHYLQTGMHVGTHMDGPMHMIAGGKYLSDFSVDKFFGRGFLINARGRKEISEDLLDGFASRREAINRVSTNWIILVMTGFSEKFGQPEYYEKYPEITEGFARRLVELGVSIVGMDTPSPDREPFKVHKILLGKEILIIENLTNLEKLIEVSEFDVVALPAKLKADSAMCRVVAGIGVRGKG